MYWRFIFLFIIFLPGCFNRSDVPDYVIPKAKMVPVLVDMHIADATINLMNLKAKCTNFQEKKYFDLVLEKQQVTSHEFDISIKFYSSNPLLLDKMYEEVLNTISRMEGDLIIEIQRIPFNEEIKKPGNMSYQINFETKLDSYLDKFIYDKEGRNSSKSMLIESSNRLGLSIGHIVHDTISTLEINTTFFIQIKDSLSKTFPAVISCFQKDGKEYDKKQMKLNAKIDKPNSWYQVMFNTRHTYPKQFKNCEYKYYLENAGKSRILIDEFYFSVDAK